MKYLLTFAFLMIAGTVLADPLPANRKISWTQVGLTNGYAAGVPDSQYSDYCTVTVSIPGYSGPLADPTGATDSSFAINNAITNFVNSAGDFGVIEIPAGNYLLTNQISLLEAFPKVKRIILRGVAGHTFMTNTAVNGDGILIFQGSLSATTFSNSIVSGATNGSTMIAIQGGNSVTAQIGNYYGIMGYNMPVTSANYAPCSGTSNLPWPFIGNGCNSGGTIHAVTQIDQVTNVVNGTNVFLLDPIAVNVMTNGPYMSLMSISGGCGVENLGLQFSQEGNPIRSLIRFSLIQDSWVTGCILTNTFNNFIELTFASHCLIRSNIIGGTVGGEYDGGHGYGVWDFDSGAFNLVEDNIFQHCRHSYASEGWVVGDVFGYNYETNQWFQSTAHQAINAASGSIVLHNSGASFILIEGNFYDYASIGDNVLGDGDISTVFRNRSTPISYTPDNPLGLTNQNGCISLNDASNCQYESYIGNVLGLTKVSQYYQSTTTNAITSDGVYGGAIYTIGFECSNSAGTNGAGIPPNCLTNLIRSMNWDTVTGLTNTDAGVDTTLPNSYYLTSKPSWWNSRPWPSIGPDLLPMASPNPAMDRFYGVLPPTPPTVFYPPYLAGTPVVIQPTPDAAWYQFGGNGGTGNDSSGNGNTATYPNGGTFGTVSIGTKSVHVITLDGSTQFGQVADNSTLHFASSFSVSCWFKTTVNATEMFVSKYDSGFTVGFDAHQGHGSPSTSCIGSEIDSVGPGHLDNIAGGTGLNDGNWHHQVIVKDVTGNTFHLYVDGVHRASATITVGSLAGATGNMELGALFDVSNIDFLNGSLADVELYSTALSQAQVTALYNNGNGAR